MLKLLRPGKKSNFILSTTPNKIYKKIWLFYASNGAGKIGTKDDKSTIPAIPTPEKLLGSENHHNEKPPVPKKKLNHQ
ncbi:MAG: hypothetical protein L6Q59_15080 [Ignavibacteriaceae bacterium]|nr:hypothetical protein [Ignavibacteriaceae bacterium]